MKKLILLLIVCLGGLVAPGVNAQSISINIGDRPYYNHGPGYWYGRTYYVWVPGHWKYRYGHKYWVHGHYRVR
jgi:hypothetical protein